VIPWFQLHLFLPKPQNHRLNLGHGNEVKLVGG